MAVISLSTIVYIYVVQFVKGPQLITLTSPKDGLITNNPQQTFTGFVRVGANLTINDQVVSLKSPDFDFNYTVYLKNGANTVTIQATDLQSNLSMSTSVRLFLDSIAPAIPNRSTISVSKISGRQIKIVGSAGTVEPDATVSARNLTSDKVDTTIAESTGAFHMNVTASAGDSMALSAEDNVENKSPALFLTVEKSYGPAVSIISPQSGTANTSEIVNVVGQYRGTADDGLKVNNEPACVVDNKFYLPEVKYGDGVTANLVATLTRRDGTTETASTVITNTGELFSNSYAMSNCGYDPLTVTFMINDDHSSDPIRQVDIDFEGDGAFSLDVPLIDGSTSHEYKTVGAYFPTVRVVTVSGSTTTTHLVVVQSFKQLDALLRGQFNGMVQNLLHNNIPTALQAIYPTARAKYKETFESAGPNLSSAANNLGTLLGGTVTRDSAEYILVRNESGVAMGYHVHFVRAYSGVWYIADF